MREGEGGLVVDMEEDDSYVEENVFNHGRIGVSP